MIELPNVDELKRVTQALATLDLIICPEWEDRYYSYDATWSETEEMASMRNGCGDDWFILFDASGSAAIKGLAHEYPSAGDAGLVEQIRRALPSEFADFASEPAFHWDSTSFCYWRLKDDAGWNEAPEQSSAKTGADEFLGILGNPLAGYREFASDYFEQEVPVPVIEHVLSHRAITAELVSSLNPEIRIEDIREELDEIGYPC